jgi:protoporphyrin/coproporphyrin ferrochelatase
MTDPRPTSGSPAARRGVLLLAHGAPDRLADIPEFLLNVRSGRKLPEPVVREIVHRYELIGGGSPLLEITRRQAAALERALDEPVYVGMRNWRPFIAEAVERMAADGLERAVALCLAPQNSRTSIGLYRKSLEEALARCAPAMQVDFVENWHNHPGLIAAFAEKVLAALDGAEAALGRSVPLVFTAHSVPERTIAEGDPYEQQVRETARLVVEVIGKSRLPDYRLAFQSQGMTAEPWIGPRVESRIDALAAQGRAEVLLAPVGFVADHVEILYDIDVLFRNYGRERGVRVLRSESLNDSPRFIQALAALVRERRAAATSGGAS